MNNIIEDLGKAGIIVADWDIRKKYPYKTFTVDYSTWISYISRKPVPANTPITDINYWKPVIKPSEEMRLWLQDIDNKINSFLESIGGTAFSVKFGNSNLVGICQKALTEAFDGEDLCVEDELYVKFANKEYDTNLASGLGRIYLRKNPTYVYYPWLSVRVNGTVYLMYYDKTNDKLYGIYNSDTEKGLILLNNLVTEKTNYDISDLPEEVNENYLNYVEEENNVYVIELPNGKTITSTELNQTRIYRYEDGKTAVINTLIQNMINKPNTVYRIQYDYDLNGQRIVVPNNCVLKFEGGKLTNGTLVLNDTIIVNENNLIGILNNTIIEGTTKNESFNATWFVDDISINYKESISLRSALETNVNIIYFTEGHYCFSEATSYTDKSLIGDKNVYIHCVPKNNNDNALKQLILINGSSKVLIKDIIIEGIYNESYETTEGIVLFYINDVNNVIFDNVVFNNIKSAYMTTSHNFELINCVGCKNVEIINCEFNNVNSNEWIYIVPSLTEPSDKDRQPEEIDENVIRRKDVNVTFNNNYIHDTFGGATPLFAVCNILKIEGNKVERSYYTGSLFNAYGSFVYCNNNIIKDCRYSSIFDTCEWGDWYCDTIYVDNNIVECKNADLVVTWAKNIYIRNNTCKIFSLITTVPTRCTAQEIIDPSGVYGGYEKYIEKYPQNEIVIIEGNKLDCTNYDVKTIYNDRFVDLYDGNSREPSDPRGELHNLPFVLQDRFVGNTFLSIILLESYYNSSKYTSIKNNDIFAPLDPWFNEQHYYYTGTASSNINKTNFVRKFIHVYNNSVLDISNNNFIGCVKTDGSGYWNEIITFTFGSSFYVSDEMFKPVCKKLIVNNNRILSLKKIDTRHEVTVGNDIQIEGSISYEQITSGIILIDLIGSGNYGMSLIEYLELNNNTRDCYNGSYNGHSIISDLEVLAMNGSYTWIMTLNSDSDNINDSAIPAINKYNSFSPKVSGKLGAGKLYQLGDKKFGIPYKTTAVPSYEMKDIALEENDEPYIDYVITNEKFRELFPSKTSDIRYINDESVDVYNTDRVCYSSLVPSIADINNPTSTEVNNLKLLNKCFIVSNPGCIVDMNTVHAQERLNGGRLWMMLRGSYNLTNNYLFEYDDTIYRFNIYKVTSQGQAYEAVYFAKGDGDGEFPSGSPYEVNNKTVEELIEENEKYLNTLFQDMSTPIRTLVKVGIDNTEAHPDLYKAQWYKICNDSNAFVIIENQDSENDEN